MLKNKRIEHFKINTLSRLSPNVSTTPIMAMGCWQCLSPSVVQLKGKHCRKPHCCNGFVDTFELSRIYATKVDVIRVTVWQVLGTFWHFSYMVHKWRCFLKAANRISNAIFFTNMWLQIETVFIIFWAGCN